MSDNNDKYPESSDRRRFVKGVVGASALSGVAAVGGASVDLSTTPSGFGGGPTTFRGIQLEGGPAPRGMPQIPVELDDEGYLRGMWPEVEFEDQGGQQIPVARTEIGGVEYNTTWFQYCGAQTSPALKPQEELDTYFRYKSAPGYEWQSNNVEAGDRIHIDDFQDYEEWGNGIGQDGLGKPAQANWRSNPPDSPDEMLEPRDRIPVQIIRSPRIEEKAQDDEWLGASTAEGFIAIQSQCTHFCCVPGFKTIEGSADFGAEDKIYCQCHQSVYDPFVIEEQQFVALPRPSE